MANNITGGGPSTNVGIVVTLNNAQAAAAFSQLNVQLNSLRTTVGSLGSAFDAFDKIIGLIAVGSLVKMAENFLDMMAQMERLTVQVAAFSNSFAQANEEIKSLITLSQSAPFSKFAITDAFIKFKAAGLDPIIDNQGNGPLKDMLSAVAAFGGTDATIKSASYAIQEMAGKGVVSLKELRRQLGQAIPTAIRDMAEGMGVSVAKLTAEVTKGNVTFEQGINAMLATWHTKYKGALDLFVNTFIGAQQQLKATLQSLTATLNSAGILDLFTAGLQMANKYFKEFVASLTLAGAQSAIIEFFRNMATNVAIAINAMENAGSIVKTFITTLAGITGALPGEIVTGGIMGYMLFGKKGAAAGAIFAAFSADFAQIAQFIGGSFELLIGIVKTLGVEDVAAGGLVGFLLFGKKGALLGMATGAAGDFIGSIQNVMFQFQRLASAQNARRDALAKGGSEEEANQAFVNEGNRVTQAWKNNPSIIGYWGKDLPAALGQTTQAVDTTKSKIEGLINEWVKMVQNVAAGRAAFEGLGKNQDIGGASQSAQKFIEKFTNSQVEIESRIAGQEAGGSGVVQYVTKKQNEIREANQVLAQMTQQLKELEAAGASKSSQIPGLTKDIEDFKKQIAAVNGDLGKMISLENEKVFEKISTGVSEAMARIDAVTMKDTLGPVAAAAAQVQDKYIKLKDTLTGYLEQAQKITGDDKLRAQAIDQITLALKRLDTAEALETVTATRAAQRKLEDEQKSVTNEIGNLSRQAGEFSAANNYDATGVAIEKLNQKYADYGKTLDNTIEKMRRLKEDQPGQAGFADQQIATLELLRQKVASTYDEALQRTIYETSAVGKLWKTVGDQIESSLGDAIDAIINRTGKLQDVLTRFYQAITKAMTDYLVKESMSSLLGNGSGKGGLGFSLFQAAGGGGSGDSGWGTFMTAVGGLFGGSAKGNVFRGAVKPFATGDIIGGPTLFGLAGEAGTEAIMPLARGPGGNLGVRMHGGGGDHNHIHIHAIDTQTGYDFLMRHADSVVAAMASRMRLNRGPRSVMA